MDNPKSTPTSKRKTIRVETESSSSKKTKNENSDEEIINVDRLSEDSSVLYSYFPKEIWLLIADSLVDTSTLTNLMEASLVFRNLLLTRRLQILFPQVWKVLGMKYETESDEVYDYKIDEMNAEGDRFRFEFKKTPWCSRILKLRLVCKSWCRGVDKFYENLPDADNYKMEGDNKIDVNERSTEKEVYFSKGKYIGDWSHKPSVFNSPQTKIEDFMEHFDPTHFHGKSKKNPIFSRFIWIAIEDSNGKNTVLSLLSKYGHHIWFCHICLKENFPTRIAFYTVVTEILELLPNLKTMKLAYCFDDLFSDSDSDADMKRSLASNPLPKLCHLQFLSLDNFPACILNLLVSANSHVSMLEVTGDHEVRQGYDIYTCAMPNLKQLSMIYYSRTEWENLKKPEVNWPLHKIYLDFGHCPMLPWSEIFSLLEKNWSETLKEVIIDTSNPIEECRPAMFINYGSIKTLNLPNIQRLRFITDEYFSLDFILPLKSLEVLEVALSREHKFKKSIVTALRLLEKNQVVKFVGYFQRFYQSNIWNLFPNLKSFKLGVADSHDPSFETIYTRKESENVSDGELKPSKHYNLWYR